MLQSKEIEKSANKKKEKKNRFANNVGWQIALKLFGKGIDANAQATYEHLKTVANDEMVRDVQTKIMHDNAFAGIGNSINELLKIFFENVDEMYIVHPVAIYYDN